MMLWGVAATGCATGNMADPDADGLFDDVDQKVPPDDTGKMPADAGSDAVVGDDVPSELDAGPADTGTMDAGTADTGTMDTGPRDTGVVDTGPRDTGPRDTGPVDTGPVDTGPVDTGPVDTGPADTGPIDTRPMLVCNALAGSRTCRGNGDFPPCCIPILITVTCGCQLPLVGCFACP
jgi:hypothetical protein